MLRAIVLAALAIPGVALAANHQTLNCLDCHSWLRTPPGAWSDRDWREYGICLKCHDGGGEIPDVMRGAAAMLESGLVSAGDGRSGGALNMLGDSGERTAGYDESRGHTIGSTQPPPGWAGTWPDGARLVCRSCHAIHPNGKFRNLGPDLYLSLADSEYGSFFGRLFPPEAQPTYATVAEGSSIAEATADVLVVVPNGAAMAWDASRIVYLVYPDRHAMNVFCATCHGAFHGDESTRSESAFVRHPTSGVALEKSMRGWLAAAKQPLRVSYRTDGTAEVACLTCHRAHGTRNPFGLVYWDRESTSNNEDGAGNTLESLCRCCHAL